MFEDAIVLQNVGYASDTYDEVSENDYASSSGESLGSEMEREHDGSVKKGGADQNRPLRVTKKTLSFRAQAQARNARMKTSESEKGFRNLYLDNGFVILFSKELP